MSSKSATTPSILFLRTTSLVLLAYIIAVPLFGNITPIYDDFNYMGPWLIDDSFLSVLQYHWNFFVFRPIDIVGTYFVDTKSLNGLPYFFINFLGLLLVILALRSILIRLASKNVLSGKLDTAFFIATSWLLIHPATAITLWQLDTASQMWSASAGLWLGIVLWDIVDRSSQALPIGKTFLYLVIITLLGLFTKVTFMGWCLGYSIILACLFIYFRKKDPRIAKPLIPIILVLILFPVSYVLIRYQFSSLPIGRGKYTGDLGYNLLKNGLLTIIGNVSTGPNHTLRDPTAPWQAQALTLSGIISTLILIFSFLFYTARQALGNTNKRNAALIIAIIAILSLLANSAGFPTSHISEVYLMGPNVSVAIIIALSVTYYQEASLANRMTILRPIILLILSLIIITSIFGIFSRAQHFLLTWDNAAILKSSATSEIKKLPGSHNKINIVIAGKFSREGFSHSTYIFPAGIVMKKAKFENWLNHIYQDKDISVYYNSDLPNDVKADIILTGEGLSERPKY